MSSAPRASLSPEVRAEAAAWVAKIHGSERTRALESALTAWLTEDPAHARAFDLATQAWELGGAVPGTLVPRIGPAGREPQARRWRQALAAAVVTAIVVSALLYFRDPAYTTGIGEQRSLVLDDGTRVTLNTASRITVHFGKAERDVRLESGEAYFDVAKNLRRPFIVSAGHESVIAVGPAFSVRRDGEVVEVTLVEGTVRVAPASTPDSDATTPRDVRVLTPGQRLRVTGATPKLDRPNIEAVTAWRRGEVVLDHTRLSDAVAEMNRYSRVPLVLSAPESAEIEVSGIFRAGDSARFARAIAETYRIEVKDETDRILLDGPPRANRH